MIPPSLDERLRRILRFVVESHVTSAEPIGSQYVRAEYHLSISPATIRNAMHELETLGLLSHPHTSAGRVPTEAGYRYYVDELMRPQPVRAATRRAFDQALGAAPDRVAAIESRVAPILASASRQLAVVALQAADRWVTRRVDWVALDDGALLIAIGDESGRRVTHAWQPAEPVAPEALRRASAWVHARLPVHGARGLTELGDRAREGAPRDIAGLLAEGLARAANAVASAQRPAVRIEGADHITGQPEFQSPETLRPLVALLAEHEQLARALEPFAHTPRARVRIGQEVALGGTSAYALVGIGVRLGGLVGAVGVVGPVRMPYRRIVSLVGYVGERLVERP